MSCSIHTNRFPPEHTCKHDTSIQIHSSIIIRMNRDPQPRCAIIILWINEDDESIRLMWWITWDAHNFTQGQSHMLIWSRAQKWLVASCEQWMIYMNPHIIYTVNELTHYSLTHSLRKENNPENALLEIISILLLSKCLQRERESLSQCLVLDEYSMLHYIIYFDWSNAAFCSQIL